MLLIRSGANPSSVGGMDDQKSDVCRLVLFSSFIHFNAGRKCLLHHFECIQQFQSYS